MCIELRIKLKSLAEESRIIRKEELRHKGKWSYKAETLIAHRKFVVRPEARATHIAYGLLKGRKYEEIEPLSYHAPKWNRVREMIKKYGGRTDLAAFEEMLRETQNLKLVS